MADVRRWWRGPNEWRRRRRAGTQSRRWNTLRYPSPYTVPPGIAMWGGGPGQGQGANMRPGTYTVKVGSGSWSETQTFKMLTNLLDGGMSEADGAEQLRLSNESPT